MHKCDFYVNVENVCNNHVYVANIMPELLETRFQNFSANLKCLLEVGERVVGK